MHQYLSQIPQQKSTPHIDSNLGIFTVQGSGSQIFSTYYHSLNSKLKVPIVTSQEARQIYLELKSKKWPKGAVNKKNWKNQQIALLIYLVEKFSIRYSISKVVLVQDCTWEQVSDFLPGRSKEDCKYKVLSLTAPTITNLPWEAPQRQMLVNLIDSQNFNWNIISQKLYESNQDKIYRTSKQCRQHYMCFLKPNLKKGQWTEDEDYQLICLFLQYGRKWSKIMKFIEGRNQNSIKNRFFLIFENKGKISNNSDLIRKVKRRKQKMQKIMKKQDSTNDIAQPQNLKPQSDLTDDRPGHQQSLFRSNRQSLTMVTQTTGEPIFAQSLDNLNAQQQIKVEDSIKHQMTEQRQLVQNEIMMPSQQDFKLQQVERMDPVEDIGFFQSFEQYINF